MVQLFRCLRVAAVVLGLSWALGMGSASGLAHAQQERFELGQRLRRFELAWQAATPEVRRRSVAPMQSAVQSFFSFQLQTAGRHLDQAYLAMLAEPEASPVHRFALSRMLKLKSTACDASLREIEFQVQPFYKVDTPAPSDTKVDISLQTWAGKPICNASFALQETTAGCKFPIGQLEEGDYRLQASVQAGGESVVFAQRNWSCIADLEQRLNALDHATGSRSEAAPATELSSTDRQSIQQMAAWINASQSGESLEVDYPAARLLELCEDLQSEGHDARAIWRRYAQQGDTWMKLAQDKQQVVVRLRCPQQPVGPMPVLFSLHGAGGSENMFFETYGAGRLVDLALQRGWMVVAPRQGLFGLGMNCAQMLEQLQSVYDIDRSRVFLLGHSMGAMQVVQQTQLHPSLPRAAVAVGGGGRLGRRTEPYPFPWFVAAGELDFGRGAAQALADNLEKTGNTVRYVEIPEVEHMVIVQAALDEIFSFLDNQPQR